LSPFTSTVAENLTHAEAEVVPAWKQELNERLAATRTRRRRGRENQIELPGLEGEQGKNDSRAAQLAAKVAQRYANAPSYSDVLAAAARARAEAKAMALAARETSRPALEPVLEPEQEDQSVAVAKVEEIPIVRPEAVQAQVEEPAQEVEPAPVVEPLAVNLIEHPRELVAPRRARPRLAEGPLRDAPHGEKDQLKIFEVANESISKTVSIGKTPANWAPIRLDTEPVEPRPAASLALPQTTLQTASIEDRIMAGIFDLSLVIAAFAVFVLVFFACTTHPPMGKPALAGAALVFAGFGLLYHYLFFKYAEATPGMRYAKIALCTFDDENPSRQAMCRRVMFLMLSAAPLGLGFAWAWFDPDRLSWHDRLSRIYQRSYS
jgi:uncharacterized RDD family membrane protein YckC